MSAAAFHHVSVLPEAFVQALQPKNGAIIVDGTFGAGGHSRRLLESAACNVYGIDRDERAIAAGETLRLIFPDRLHLLLGRFADMESLLNAQGINTVDAIGLDIGVSSMYFDDAENYGGSFREDAPLNMRMSRDGVSAADLVNDLEEVALADIIYRYGEERQSRRIARAIVLAREEAPITRTLVLADIVRKALGYRAGPKDPATRTFQALRIAVNDELGELERALAAAERLLKAGGRLAVISFHSLEDRIVKNFFRARSGGDISVSRHMPQVAAAQAAPTFTDVAKPVRPDDEEITRNPRARSATLRAATRTTSPALENMQ
jgi:16S rRNA (cytosine1402-N4)-methyltransferase